MEPPINRSSITHLSGGASSNFCSQVGFNPISSDPHSSKICQLLRIYIGRDSKIKSRSILTDASRDGVAFPLFHLGKQGFEVAQISLAWLQHQPAVRTGPPPKAAAGSGTAAGPRLVRGFPSVPSCRHCCITSELLSHRSILGIADRTGVASDHTSHLHLLQGRCYSFLSLDQ